MDEISFRKICSYVFSATTLQSSIFKAFRFLFINNKPYRDLSNQTQISKKLYFGQHHFNVVILQIFYFTKAFHVLVSFIYSVRYSIMKHVKMTVLHYIALKLSYNIYCSISQQHRIDFCGRHVIL